MIDKMNAPHLPTGQNISPKLLKTFFQKCYNPLPEYPTLAHSIIVPLRWQTINKLQSVPINGKNLTPLAIWVAKPNKSISPSIQVQVAKLTQEISAHHWLRYYATVSEQQILTLQTESVSFADSLVKFQHAEQVVIKRTTAVIHGQWLVFVSGLARESDYPALAETFGLAVTSFTLLKPAEPARIEPWTHYQLAERLQFDCPASWQTRFATDKEIELYQDENHSLLKVALESQQRFDKPAEVLEKALDNFTQIRIQELLHSAPLPNSSLPGKNHHLLIYQGTLKDKPSELWISFYEDNQYYTVISLLTVSRDTDFYQWAVNKRAYGILLQSLV